MKIEVTDNGRIRVVVPAASGRKYGPSMTPEEAVKFGTELINKAYPLTKAVKIRTEIPPLKRGYPSSESKSYTPGRCSVGYGAEDFLYWRDR